MTYSLAIACLMVGAVIHSTAGWPGIAVATVSTAIASYGYARKETL